MVVVHEVAMVEIQEYGSRFYAFAEKLVIHDVEAVDNLRSKQVDIKNDIESLNHNNSNRSFTKMSFCSSCEKVVTFTDKSPLGFRVLQNDAKVSVHNNVFNATVAFISGQAQKAGIKAGMVLTNINGATTKTLSAITTMWVLRITCKISYI